MIDILKLGRFHFLFGGFLIYSLGALIAVKSGANADILKYIFGYLVFFPAHLSVSYSNDLYDIEADRHNTTSPFSGGSGVLLRRPDLIPMAKGIAIGLITVSILLSIVFMMIYDRSLLFPLLVASGCLLGWAYTGPPFRLAYRRLGEVSTVIAVGLIVLFMGYFVMMRDLELSILFFLFPQLLYGIQFIMSVQMPDYEADFKGGKTTLVVLYGRKFSFILLFFSTLGASIFYTITWAFKIGPIWETMGTMALFSTIPVIATIPSIILRPKNKKMATRLVTLSMSSMFIFLMGINLYFLFTQ